MKSSQQLDQGKIEGLTKELEVSQEVVKRLTEQVAASSERCNGLEAKVEEMGHDADAKEKLWSEKEEASKAQVASCETVSFSGGSEPVSTLFDSLGFYWRLNKK